MTTSEYTPPRYGNWRRPRTAGIGKLNWAASIVLLVGLAVTVMTLLIAGIVPALVAGLVFGAAVLATLFEDVHGQNLGVRLGRRVAWWRTRKVGAHLYRSGPLGWADFGRFRAPGLLAPSRLLEGRDAFGAPFALVRIPATGHYSLVLRCDPPDTYGVDDPVIDQWVANLGGWIAGLADEYDVRAAAITLETSPSTGAEYRAELDSRRSASSPAFAAAVIDELREAGAGGSAVRGWVSITFRATAGAGGRRGDEQMIRDVGVRVAAMCADLASTGAGAVRAATAGELCELVRVSYDPATAALFDAARADGQSVELSWDEVGPAGSQAAWSSYTHDSGASITWAMSGPPRGHVTSGVLRRLLEPMGGIARKRVTLLYQPMSPADAATTVERDLRDANNRASGPNPPARARLEARAAARSAEEEAMGAAVVDFGMLVTATVIPTDGQSLAWARTSLENAARASRVRMRPCYGSQDSAFAASLPLGIVLPDHVSTPSAVRKAVG